MKYWLGEGSLIRTRSIKTTQTKQGHFLRIVLRGLSEACLAIVQILMGLRGRMAGLTRKLHSVVTPNLTVLTISLYITFSLSLN
jgi:hypothetical protein